ncbi:MAG: threonine--tRNA ligase [Chloroflexi bacterium]|nr:threonine--tRNA ligase [Chloroflexota bacterium]
MAEKNNHNEDFLHQLRHSTAHVMAQAVLEMFPEGKIAIGPPIEDGFYYDFDLPRSLTPEDLEVIEQRMREVIGGNHPFLRRDLSPGEAKALYADQPYKLELIDGIVAGGVDEYGEKVEGDVVLSTYKHDAFEDLCRGPHVDGTGQIPVDAFKLLSIAGAYWRGDERRPMLQRIYGTVWPHKAELDDYLHRLEEAERRDHRKLAYQLDLYSTHEEAGAGLIYWHPNGARIRHEIETFWREEHFKGGYDLVYTPHIGKADLWQTSGHLEFYSEGMYAPLTIDEQEYYLKPMNCPFAILIYNSRRRSYRELPFRWAELGTVYRYERSGVLHGLLRVRGFTQDDAHLICRPDQMPEEILRVLRFSLHILRAFGFQEFNVELSVRDLDTMEKYAGRDEEWRMAEAALLEALEIEGQPYKRMEGEAVFYGPKIDIKVKDALGRSWQLSTIQFDFNLPGRFDMTYVGEDGKEHRPYMIHRALLGSLERFFGVLIEHYGGAFPVWLAPVQARLIPIADRHLDFACQVQKELAAAGLRADVDASGERMQAKIRDAQLLKIPYMLVVGDREAEAGAVNLRLRTGEKRGALAVPDFVALAQEAVASKRPI